MGKEWIFNESYSFADENFSKIYRFFVIELPVENTSVRSKFFEDYGLSSKKITQILKKNIASLEKNWKIVSSKDAKKVENITQKIEDLCKKNGILDTVSERKEIFIHTNMKNNKTKSLFYSIRCGFAHGSFNKVNFFGEQFYFFENRYRNKIRGRIVVKEKTLLKIIEIIEKSAK